jgi:hypothetical protein
MAKVIINDNLSVNGKVTFNRTVNEDKTGFVIQGVLSTHLYFDDITSIETKRYKLTGVEVFQEAFGSDDYNIGYYFTCSNVEVLGQEAEGVTFILYPSEMKMIEDEMYKNEHPILGDIGEQYKEMIKEEEKTKVEEGSEN